MKIYVTIVEGFMGIRINGRGVRVRNVHKNQLLFDSTEVQGGIRIGRWHISRWKEWHLE